MKTISAREASRGFSSLLDSVYFNAEEVLIERDGLPVALISPPPQKNNLEEFNRWLADRGPAQDEPDDDMMLELEALRSTLAIPESVWSS